MDCVKGLQLYKLMIYVQYNVKVPSSYLVNCFKMIAYLIITQLERYQRKRNYISVIQW